MGRFVIKHVLSVLAEMSEPPAGIFRKPKMGAGL